MRKNLMPNNEFIIGVNKETESKLSFSFKMCNKKYGADVKN